MPTSTPYPVSLATLREMAAAGRKFAMLTAYDYPTARAAQAAGVHTLLVGDSLGMVILGHETTRDVPIDLIVTLAAAVRRGAPDVFLIGDMPYRAAAGGPELMIETAHRFRDEAGCSAVKIEVGETEHAHFATIAHDAGVDVIAHLGLRPQAVTSPDQYRAQARDAAAIRALADEARALEQAGAAMLLLEAVPPEASAAVVAAVKVPVVGCGAGPACHGFVVVTHDMLGMGAPRPPRFVPVHESFAERMQAAMQRWRDDIAGGRYPAPEHNYGLRRNA